MTWHAALHKCSIPVTVWKYRNNNQSKLPHFFLFSTIFFHFIIQIWAFSKWPQAKSGIIIVSVLVIVSSIDKLKRKGKSNFLTSILVGARGLGGSQKEIDSATKDNPYMFFKYYKERCPDGNVFCMGIIFVAIFVFGWKSLSFYWVGKFL